MLNQSASGGITVVKRPNIHSLLCREEDAVAVGNDLVNSGTIGRKVPVMIRELSMAEVSVYNPAEYRDGAMALAIEWEEKLGGDIDLSPLSAEEREAALKNGKIRFSVNAGLVFRMWTETRNAKWLKTRAGAWPDGTSMGDLRRV